MSTRPQSEPRPPAAAPPRILRSSLSLAARRWVRVARIRRALGVPRRTRRLRVLQWLAWLCIHEPLDILESLLFDRAVAAQRVAPPLFILGHWRSGTTFLQELLAVTPGYCTLTLFRALFPGTFLLTEPWLKPLLQLGSDLLGGRNHFQRTRLDFDDPAEDDLALLHMTSGTSGLWDKLLARRQRPELGSAEWQRHHRWLLRKLTLVSGGRTLVLKSAQNTWRIPAILDAYPQARFVYLHRDPIEVYRSMRWLWSVNDREYAMVRVRAREIGETVIAEYRSMIARYLADRGRIPSGRLIEVSLEAVSARPLEFLHEIGTALGIPGYRRVARLPRLPSGGRAPLAKMAMADVPLARLRREWRSGFELHDELRRSGGVRRY